MFEHRHLLSIDDLSVEDINCILDRADEWSAYCLEPVKQNNALAGFTQINAFFEPSTRTQMSFELAGKQLGACVANFNATGSSLSKGETFADTLFTLDAMMPHVLVVRHSENDAARRAARIVGCSVINAGSGTSDHPTQALLDALTLRKFKGQIAGLVVAICGDIRHSRVASSNIQCLTKLGAKVRLVGPEGLMPKVIPEGVDVFSVMEDGIKGVDVIMMLRTQWERIHQFNKDMAEAAVDAFQLTEKRLKLAAPGASIMHPGPINRAYEIYAEEAYGPQSLILQQVQLGIPVRMACLDLLLNQ